ncbi:unnamed protein product, partial [Didymodactylos carnosus]
MPGTTLQVVSNVLDHSGGLHIVHLREVDDDDDSVSDSISSLTINETTNSGSSSIVVKKKVILADSGSYDGDTVNDVPNGTGVCAWPTGRHYTGKWQDGKTHGRGVYTYANGG